MDLGVSITPDTRPPHFLHLTQTSPKSPNGPKMNPLLFGLHRSNKMSRIPMYHVESYESNMSGVSATSSEVAQVQDSRIAYESAESIDDLKRMNIAFLKGELQATAYHFGPLLAESAPLVDKLVALNELDFLTTGSQPGGTFRSQGKVYEQRFYVEGVIPRKYLALFLQRMYTRCSSVFLCIQEKEFTFEEIQMLQAQDLYWLTKTDGTGVTHIPEISGPCEMFQTCDEVYPELVDECVTVFLMDTRWSQEGTELLDAAIAVLKELREIPMRLAMQKARLQVPKLPTLSKSV
jgi:hypothetical protein